jgi:hypothetical protein
VGSEVERAAALGFNLGLVMESSEVRATLAANSSGTVVLRGPCKV